MSAGLIDDRLLRRRQVEELTGMSRASIYRLMADWRVPAACQRLGPTAARWRARDIATWLESLPVAGD